MPNIDPIAWLDQEDARIAECIRRYGVYLTYVGGAAPALPAVPEETVTKAPPSATRSASSDWTPEPRHRRHPTRTRPAAALNDLAARIREGANLVPGELITFDDWPHRIVAEELSNPARSSSRPTGSRAAQLGVGAGVAARSPRQVGPLPVGGGPRRSGQAAPSRHLDRVTVGGGRRRVVGTVGRGGGIGGSAGEGRPADGGGRSGGVGERRPSGRPDGSSATRPAAWSGCHRRSRRAPRAGRCRHRSPPAPPAATSGAPRDAQSVAARDGHVDPGRPVPPASPRSKARTAIAIVSSPSSVVIVGGVIVSR